MLQLGVAGVGQQFSSYREALRRLRNPVEIDAVFDCVFARAVTVADREEVAWESGLRALARRASVDAVLLLDPGWHGLAGLPGLAGCQKPVFVLPWLSGSAADFERIYEAATTNGVTLMPALWRRYVPAAVRTQELIATELGAVTGIHLELPAGSTASPALLSETLVGWLDFCRNLFRTFPIASRIQRAPADESATTPELREGSPADVSGTSLNLVVDFPGGTGDDVPVLSNPGDSPADLSQATRIGRANLQLSVELGTDLAETIRSAIFPTSSAVPRPGACGTLPRGDMLPVRIQCERGRAEIRSASEVAWQVDGQPLESEKLTSDRSEHDIMLDLFCRRVAGGLIPVPDYFDVSHALRIVEQAMSNADFA